MCKNMNNLIWKKE